MKTSNNVALLFASAALAAATGAFAQSAAKSVDNWRASDAAVWRNGSNELCWRDAGWTPATADDQCDGAIKPLAPAPAPSAPAPRPVAAPTVAAPPARPVAAPSAARVAVVPVQEKVAFAADALFDFDQSVLKPDAQARLAELVEKGKGVALEVVIAVGHADATGNADYNQKLSIRRAEAVKGYLVSKGIEKNRVYTEGKGATNPVADNRTAAGRAMNRRVEVEVVGTRTKQ